MEPSGHQNQSKMVLKSLLEGSRGALGGFWRPMPKNEAGDLFFGGLLGPSWRPLGTVLGRLRRLERPRWSQNRRKNGLENRSFFCWLWRSDFSMILVDFGSQNGAKLAPKSDQKSISTLKAKNQLNASRLAFSWLSGVQVGNKNRSKIDQKIESKRDCIKTTIFLEF